MLQKERVIKLYLKHKSKRKVAQILKVSRQYIIQVIKDYEYSQEQSENSSL